MRRLVPFVIILQLAEGFCPSGYELVRDGECRGYHNLMGINTDVALSAAVLQCADVQGQPVIIHDDEKQSYWTARAKDNPYLMLGLGCNADSKKWEWVDGSVLDYKPANGNYEPELNQDCRPGLIWIVMNNGHWGFGSGGTLWFDVYCTTQLPPAPNQDGCEGFDDDADDGVCYQIGATVENYQEAQQICRSFGAGLASIHNIQENSFVRRLAVSKGAVSGMFLGATIAGKGNQFGWLDGSEWDFENFYPGFPADGLGDCLAMDTTGTTGEWVNVDCSSKQAVACQRNQNYSPPECSAGPWQEGDIIYSPGFPVSASTPCDFIFSVEAGKRVQVEILLLEANSCCDHLIISEDYIGGTVIADLTGEVKDKNYTTDSSNFMRVSWQPNGGVNVWGMMMTFRAV